ncbi:Arm DNA-binding domain-containing protein [Pseudomonas sp. R16(2017)]|uniref:Arm DNA-binding domain-containing protein n=1 Tax=unclassified Pseudomonas TaxID=196821 RepID=UPI000A1F5C83
MLTDLKIRQAKSTDKNYTLSDCDGLYLFVSTSGSKLWHFRYTWLGKRNRFSRRREGFEPSSQGLDNCACKYS